MVEENALRVALGIPRPALRHRVRRADAMRLSRRDRRVRVLREVRGDAQVAQQHRAVVVHEEVGSLDVAVDEAVDVEVAGISFSVIEGVELRRSLT